MFSYPRRRHYSLQISLTLLTQTSPAVHSESMDKRNQGAFRTKNEQIPTHIHLNEAENASQPMPPVIMPCKTYPKTHIPHYGDGESYEYPSPLILRDARTDPLPARVPQVTHPKRKIAANRSILRSQPRMHPTSLSYLRWHCQYAAWLASRSR